MSQTEQAREIVYAELQRRIMDLDEFRRNVWFAVAYQHPNIPTDVELLAAIDSIKRERNAAKSKLRDAECALNACYGIATRALSEPDDGTGALVAICTEIERVRGEASHEQ